MAQVTEMRQRSVTEDPAIMGNFPNGWQIDKPSGPPMPAEESEIGEFQDRLAKIKWPRSSWRIWRREPLAKSSSH